MFITLLITLASQYYGVVYKWGGSDCNSLDCSGFVIKVLQDLGMPLSDRTAQGLYTLFTEIGDESCNPTSEPDCLIFFGKDVESITHIAISTGDEYMIEASGPGKYSLDMTKEQLLAINARVRKTKINRRGDLVASIKVKY